MGMSIRNQLAGTVTSVATGEAMASVKVRLAGGQDITAAITADAVNDLGLAPGSAVKALVKATEVAVATGPVEGISIRNQLAGAVVGVSTGSAMASVKIAVEGAELTSAITKEAVDALGLFPGSSVVALIKSTEISLAAA
ncbi:molybdopterin-binding protein [Streptomyces sp. NRRL S-87]|uniref:TOBE domain-containing protein n=1 Tax=Streptomyces sp. NRRL S-87 TaxID=1463920 RepID=UPI0004BF384F|nr:TOBE domain-containing protein [Streptomyces sp. NRRL S-87]